MIKNLLLISTLSFGILGFAQSKSAPSLKKIQSTFKFKKYSPKVLDEFRKLMSYRNAEYFIYEEVPGEIIAFFEQPTDGVSSSRSTSMFRIKDGKLKPLYYLPVNEKNKIDKAFDKKVEKYAGKDWGLAYNMSFNIDKKQNGNYLISSMAKKSGDGDCCPSKYLEYTTKDFETFTPYRISDDGKKWTIIK